MLKDNLELIILTKEQLEELTSIIVKKTIKLYVEELKTSSLPEWITNKQATKLLNKKSRLTVDNMAKRGLIRKKYRGKTPLYNYEDVKRHIE